MDRYHIPLTQNDSPKTPFSIKFHNIAWRTGRKQDSVMSRDLWMMQIECWVLLKGCRAEGELTQYPGEQTIVGKRRNVRQDQSRTSLHCIPSCVIQDMISVLVHDQNFPPNREWIIFTCGRHNCPVWTSKSTTCAVNFRTNSPPIKVSSYSRVAGQDQRAMDSWRGIVYSWARARNAGSWQASNKGTTRMAYWGLIGENVRPA